MATRDGGVFHPPLTDRLTAGQLLGIDCVAAALALTLTMFNASFQHAFHYQGPGVAVALLATAACAPAAVRRLWPLPALAVITAAGSVLTALTITPVTLDIAIGMAMYTVATTARRRLSLTALAIAELMLIAGMFAASARSTVAPDSMHTLLAAAALWFIGDTTRVRRAYLSGLALQAEQRRHQAAREERVRIARELHDILAHSLAVVTVRAGIGRMVMDARPEEARLALEAVERTGRGALDELRRIVTLLRDDAGEPSLAPAPGIGDLTKLAAQVRAAGVPVDLLVEGEPDMLSAAAGLSVYRIVQEALTNVIKHAGPARARVSVKIATEGVHVEVVDNGQGASRRRSEESDPGDVRSHHGTVGMRERAIAFGGTLKAGPSPDGGFAVDAFLPATGGRK